MDDVLEGRVCAVGEGLTGWRPGEVDVVEAVGAVVGVCGVCLIVDGRLHVAATVAPYATAELEVLFLELAHFSEETVALFV